MIRRVMKMRNAIECCRDLKFELNFDDVVNIHIEHLQWIPI